MTKEISQEIPNATSPEARAERLKKVRNLANLTRKQMCENSDININTYIGYEVGRYGGLTRWGTDKVIKRVLQEGVQCTFDWLMYNIGSSPILISDFKKHIEAATKEDLQKSVLLESDDKAFIQEILFFRQQHELGVDYIIHDDTMFPYYAIGECVAGIKRYGELIASVIGQDCIMQTDEGKILFRRLSQGAEVERYNLVCLNPQTLISQPILYNIKLISAAPVIWRRKKDFS